jgi:hypothetical protein
VSEPPRSPESAVALLGILLAVILTVAAFTVAPPQPRTGTHQAQFSAPAPMLKVALGAWSGQSANVSVTCGACSENISANSTLNISLQVVPRCGPFGCSAELNGTVAAAPFTVTTVVPGLPAPLAQNGSTFVVSLRAPDRGGRVFLNGSVSASDLPGPVVLDEQNWVARNSTNGSEGVRITPVLTNPLVAGGSVVNETLIVNNTGPLFEDVNRIAVAPPFRLVATGPGFPFEVNWNESGVMWVKIQVPVTPGSYTLNGTMTVAPLPEVQISSIVVNFVGANVSILVSSVAGIPTYNLPGGEFNGSLVLLNPTNASHELAFNHTTGPFSFTNGTPSTPFVIAAHAQFRYYLTLSVTPPPGAYGLGLVFTILYEPWRPSRRAPGVTSR